MLRKLVGCCWVVLLASCSRDLKPAGETAHFVRDNASVVVSPTSGPARKVRLTVLSPKVIRVTAFPTESLQLPPSLMSVAKANGAFTASEKDGVVSVKTAGVLAQVALDGGRVTFRDAQGNIVLNELAAGRPISS